MDKKIIIDCDNTFSVEGCDIDDGLAIIYSLAEENSDLLGVTTTFGNNSLDIVYPNTLEFMKNIGFENIPVLRGEVEDYRSNEAGKFLVEMADRYAGQLTILATGSMTNLYHAWQRDNSFYTKVSEISLMGGITEELIINGKKLDELNFSCNVEASLNVLEKGKNISIATGNTCLDGFFTRERFDSLGEGNDFEKWLHSQSQYWFDRERDVFDNEGIYIWDILSALVIYRKNLFDIEEVEISPDQESMKEGLLFGKGAKNLVKIPRIKDVEKYMEDIYSQYKKFGEKYFRV